LRHVVFEYPSAAPRVGKEAYREKKVMVLSHMKIAAESQFGVRELGGGFRRAGDSGANIA
jgi:hypothetical protein